MVSCKNLTEMSGFVRKALGSLLDLVEGLVVVVNTIISSRLHVLEIGMSWVFCLPLPQGLIAFLYSGEM